MSQTPASLEQPEASEEPRTNSPIKRASKNDPATLHPGEIWWRDRYQVLLDNGYQLRPRFRPDWKPSWQGKNVHPFTCEDAVPNIVCSLHLALGVIRLIAVQENSYNGCCATERQSYRHH